MHLSNQSNVTNVPTAASERYNDDDVLFAEALAAMSLSSEHARFADSDAASDVSRTSDEERLLDLELRIRILLAGDGNPDTASEFDRHISSAEGTRQLELAAAFLSGAGLSAASSAASHDRLSQSVEFWFEQTDHGDDCAAVCATASARKEAWQAIENEPHAAEFKDFLDGLTETADAEDRRLRPQYRQRIAHLLTALQDSPPLREQCFLLVEDATTSCGDRIGLTLNNLDMARIEYEAAQGNHSAQGLIDIRTSQFRIRILNELAQQKITQLRPTLGDDLDEIEVMHGTVTLMAEELNLIGVSRTMLYESYAHFSEDDKRSARALIAQRESRSDYIKFIAEWKPWQQQLRRMRPADFADLDLQVAREQESLCEQPSYTSDNDYVELCRQMEGMQRSRLTFSLESWTREWLVQNRQRTPGPN